MSYEALIGRALLNGEDPDKVGDMMTVKMTASSQITCPTCKRILDQERTVVMEVHGVVKAVNCAACYDELTKGRDMTLFEKGGFRALDGRTMDWRGDR